MKKIFSLGVLALAGVILIGFGTRFAVQYTKTLPAVASQQLTQPTSCIDEPDAKPVITSLSATSGSVGAKIEINGCNFSGFEGDKDAWIENDKGAVGILRGEEGSTSKLLRVALTTPLCQKDVSYTGAICEDWLALTPGIYKIYVAPWGKESNKIEFTINASTTNSTAITYYILEKPNTNNTFCNGADMDGAGFKAALTKKITTSIPGNATTEEKIIKTLSLAAAANSFNASYARVDEVSYKNNVVSMGPADGWAGSSIFYCAWKPFVEKNLEQFPEVKEIIWGAFPDVAPTQIVKIYFNNIKFDPGLMDCSNVYAVNRSIKPTSAVAMAALEELFKGPTINEKSLGYMTNLNSGVKIQKLTIENGLAKVDFSAELEKDGGGSCRTAAIIAQIKQTLKQFSSVQDVLISINGQTEDILQP